jgi:hypothetical protein
MRTEPETPSSGPSSMKADVLTAEMEIATTGESRLSSAPPVADVVINHRDCDDLLARLAVDERAELFQLIDLRINTQSIQLIGQEPGFGQIRDARHIDPEVIRGLFDLRAAMRTSRIACLRKSNVNGAGTLWASEHG